jgi:hypothetical protein
VHLVAAAIVELDGNVVHAVLLIALNQLLDTQGVATYRILRAGENIDG